jgi:hypothetical protein
VARSPPSEPDPVFWGVAFCRDGLTPGEKSAKVIGQLRKWLDQHIERIPPKSILGRAMHYLHHQWPHLIRYLEDGNYPIDNNPAENAIRPFVIGRKNWLFSATPRGAEASATIRPQRNAGRIGPNRRRRLRGRSPEGRRSEPVSTA